MPYIKQSDRDGLDPQHFLVPLNAGELNYVISREIRNYWRNHSNYQGINDIVGALEGAKMEFYRRVVENYENSKIAENGDIY